MHAISVDICDRLHWLPIHSRIDFKLGLLDYKCLHGTEMLVQKSTVPVFALWSEVIFLCQEQKRKQLGPGTIYLTI